MKIKGVILIIIGFIMLTIGGIGIFFPILPTTPFVLVSAACFGGSSPKLYGKLLHSKYFGEFIDNYKNKTGIKKVVKIRSIIFLWVTLIISALIFRRADVTIILLTVGVGVTIHIATIKTRRTEEMKYSKQRQLIQQTVTANNGHLTADDVYAILKPDNPNLSLGTVYRNLNMLVSSGAIKKISIANSSDRFDGIIAEHSHVVCSKCGKVFDLELSAFETLDAKIAEQTGITDVSHQLVISGVCGDCAVDKQ